MNSRQLDEVLRGDPTLNALLSHAQKAALPLEGVYLVGGYVRDLLLGRPHFDIDLTVEGDGVEFAQQLAEAVGGRALSHEGFGTAAVVGTVAGTAVRVDVATSRTERYEQPGALPVVAPAPLVDDLQRRDFTINALAIALDPVRLGELIDAFGGVADLQDGLLRTLHERSFIDDPTRMLRAARYAGRYGFSLDESTMLQMQRAMAAGALQTVSGARVRDDLELLLEEPAADAVAMLDSTGLARSLHPELDCGQLSVQMIRMIDDGMARPGHSIARDEDVRQVLAWRMRMAVLVRSMSMETARDWFAALRVQRRDVRAIADNVTALRAVTDEAVATAAKSDRQLHELFDPLAPEAHELAELLARKPEVRVALERFHQHLAPLALNVDGHYLLSLGLERGPAVGEVLTELYELKLDGQLPDETRERAAAHRIVQTRLSQG